MEGWRWGGGGEGECKRRGEERREEGGVQGSGEGRRAEAEGGGDDWAEGRGEEGRGKEGMEGRGEEKKTDGREIKSRGDGRRGWKERRDRGVRGGREGG